MKEQIIRAFIIALTLFPGFAMRAQAQGLEAVDDAMHTGPLQTVRKDVILNDLIPGDTYSWRLLDAPPERGTFVQEGDFLKFTPAATCPLGTFPVRYELSGSYVSDTAVVSITVTEFNNPVNVIDPDIECFNYMPANITFDIHRKYASTPGPGSGNYIDAMTSPLVGDLNGDGKPEIVMMGNEGTSGVGASTTYKYINIYNGQTGARLVHYDFVDSLGGAAYGYGEMSIGSPYHRPPTVLALADLNNDGMGEIVMCHTQSGLVGIFKPTLTGSTITGLKGFAQGCYVVPGSPVTYPAASYKAPITDTDKDVYGYPNPYIADLDADGTPEIIVYNKIYNGTGVLLMSWQDAAPTSKYSSTAATNGLSSATNSGSPLTSANATAVRGVAMTGRRPVNGTYADRYLAVPAIVDIDGDGKQEIITGNRIHKFNIDHKTDHTQNSYTTIEGPQSVEVSEGSSKVTYYLSDGFTRVADIDGDGKLDIIVVCPGNNGSLDVKIIVYVWSPDDLNNVKACVSFYSDGANGNFSIPFIGDINGKLDGWDGSGWARKLPEICILGGAMYINNSSRTGVKFHPKADEELRRGVGFDNNNTSAGTRRFNRPHGGDSEYAGHIIGLTWDASATVPQEKLKVSWAMEHQDRSDNTGITLFDFDNNNAADLCYRDETTLRVISPARSGRDYVPLGEAVSAGSSVMFSTPVYSGTAFEYPVIADVNMDGSADIVVTHIDKNSRDLDMSRGYFEVYEYQGAKWAPCPPVWNQGMYDPLQVREDLKINPRPASMLTSYTKNSETVRPYNGSWMQQPIVREGNDYRAVVRQPDAEILDMKVRVISGTSMEVTLTLRNRGSASVSAQTPITFYDGDTDGRAIGAGATRIGTVATPVGVDIFPDETVTRAYTLTFSSTNFNNRLVWARVMDSGTAFPAAGYEDCNLDNNTFSGSDCPGYGYAISVAPDTVLCGTTDNALLTATASVQTGGVQYQWYFNDVAVPGATAQTFTAEHAGAYKCFVRVGPVCRSFTPVQALTREIPVALDDTFSLFVNRTATFAVLDNDVRTSRCNPLPEIIDGHGPLHGSAVTVNDSIRYTPGPGFVGRDSLQYTLGSNIATLRITVFNRPDNIVDPEDCFVPEEDDPPPFTIKQQWSVAGSGNNYTGSLVGDLDGDGLPEIVSLNGALNSILVSNGQTGVVKATIALNTIVSASNGWQPVTLAALVDADRNGKGEIIFIKPATRQVVSYEVTNSNPFTMGEKWATGTYAFDNPTTPDNFPQPFVADFNGDGVPEVVIYNRIFNAATGAYLGYTESSVTTAYVGRIPNRLGNQCSNFLTAADFDGDGLPEIAAGGKVYKVSFNEAKTAVTCTIWSELSSVTDGYTAVADVNMDGNLDVVVVNGTGNAISATRIQIWTPATGYKFTDITVASSAYQSYPFIGDIDGKVENGVKYPEICVTTISRVSAFKYNPETGQFVAKWTLGTSDTSGATGITLFDFNNDGINEIVYRDMSVLRVLNGVADAEPTTIPGSSFPCYSGTSFEYPVIADTDGDGSANICITCESAHQLRVYESNSTPWSSTRKVWNQVNYEPLQINEDLTVPPFSVPKNMTFGDKQPYNGSLIQVPTMVNEQFSVIKVSPDPAVDSLWIEPAGANSRIWVRIANRGVRNSNASLPVALYNTGTPGTGFLQRKPVGTVILPGDTYEMYFDILANAVTIMMSVRIQDDGATFPVTTGGSFLDCNEGNNTGTVSGLLATPDYVILSADRPVRFDVRDNDYLSSCGRGALAGFDTIPASGLRHGHLAVNADSSFTYTPDNAFLGVDSLTYYIRCEGDSSAAKVYFLVQRPLSMKYVACQSASADVGFDAIAGVQYNWYTLETGGAIVSGGTNTPKRTVVKNASSVETWWVEARTTNGIVFPRYRVDLELSDNCGVVAPVGCAVNGSVIFREDFDGYDDGTNPASPIFSSVPLAAGMTTYNFATTDNGTNPVSVYQGGYYALPKRGLNLWVATYFTDDHTWPGDNTRGRFFMINGAKALDRLYLQSINGLCDGRELYFSFWAKGCDALLKWTIRSSADNSVLAVFHQSTLSGGCAAGAPWRHYGFRFTVPAGVDAVDFDVYNYWLELGGNDFAIDDIEVRFCAPPVTLLPAPFQTDTTVRVGTSFTLDGEFIDDGTFGPSLDYRWEYNATGDVNNPLAWTPIAGTEGTVATGTVNSSHTLSSVSKTDTGYYRLAVADAAHIDAYNCRAMSDIVRLRVLDGIRPDSATVQAYRQVEIDVLANDEMSASLFTPPFSLIDSVRVKPSAGTLTQTGTGDNSRLVYINRTGGGGLPNSVDSFRYAFTFFDAGVGRTVTVEATVYIYILQSRRGFTACPGESFEVSLTERPPGVQFEWYAAESPFASLGVGATRTLASMSGDSTYLVRPVTPSGAFPPGLLTVSLADPSEIRYMRWTGLVNSEWHCPDNWVEVHRTGDRTYETPTSHAPARCIPVRISSESPSYPELADSAWCAGITVENRAMLRNPHVLHYDSAQVEIALGSTERDRFIMWSAPLKHMYSGDYHFKQSGAPRWGDTYMNLFQQANPSGGTAGKNMFTATFGNPDFSLDLGKAFNLRVTSTSANRTEPWLFPQPDNFYTALSGDRYPTLGSLTRSDRHRFITDGQLLSADTTFRMNVFDENGFDLVQVVNPYLAWLDVKQFLNGNSGTLQGGYLIWSGVINEDFDAVSIDGNRYIYSRYPSLSTAPGLIPPLQSFFVQKASGAALTWLYMSPKWTTTSDGHHPFMLRAAPDDNGVLRIRASQGAGNSYAVLRYSSRAVPEYVRSEDVRTLFYDELPLTLYSLTVLREPLSINASGSFGERETALGLRLLNAGETRLEFTGMESFGHDVYLIDRERNNLEIDLQATPEYVFTVTKPSGTAALELNDRFVLRMTYTGRGLVGTSGVEHPEVLCSGGNGCLYVRSTQGRISALQVYNTLGMLLYSDRTLSSEFKVPVPGGPQTCIVKVRLENNTTVVRKVAVR